MSSPERQPATIAARCGIDTDRQFGAVVPPLHLSSTFSFESLGQKRAHDYSRSGNPTRDLLAEALTELEGGAAATVMATGMGAITTVLQLLEPGDVLVAPLDCYGGTFRLMSALARRGAFTLRWTDFSNPEQWASELDGPVRMVWLETPGNPLLRITDIEAVARAAHARGALVVADNTFPSPALQNPIALGADLVVHSTTKYINGHSDVVGGAVVSASPGLGEQIAWWANCIGVTGGAWDSWLTLRGLRTLDVRIQRQQESTVELAALLQRHPAVARVHYPGLADHPGHAVAARQQRGFGAMLSFELRGGLEAVEAFVSDLKLMTLAESLGGVESLVAHPATMTHAAMAPEDQARAGITAGLLRLSVGLEDVRDLAADLGAALDRASVSLRRVRAV